MRHYTPVVFQSFFLNLLFLSLDLIVFHLAHREGCVAMCLRNSKSNTKVSHIKYVCVHFPNCSEFVLIYSTLIRKRRKCRGKRKNDNNNRIRNQKSHRERYREGARAMIRERKNEWDYVESHPANTNKTVQCVTLMVRTIAYYKCHECFMCRKVDCTIIYRLNYKNTVCLVYTDTVYACFSISIGSFANPKWKKKNKETKLTQSYNGMIIRMPELE